MRTGTILHHFRIVSGIRSNLFFDMRHLLPVTTATSKLNTMRNPASRISVLFPVVLLFAAFTILTHLTACERAELDAPDRVLTTDLLIYGGGTSGVTAAIQAARDGVDVVVVESSPWLGGMLTTSGVSATDGNHRLPSGIWGEFREMLYDYYGGPEAVETGWVSNTHFEPHIGNRFFNEMMDELPNITRIHGYYIDEMVMDGQTVRGATFYDMEGNTLLLQAKISIDASEYGDLMARSGTDYFLGLDPRDRTGEEIAPTHGNEMIQDLTYTAILKDYGPDADMTIPRPPNYQPSIFIGACKELSADPDTFEGVDCDRMLEYAKLPNDKYLINWPIFGNDYYLNVIEMDHHERKILYEEAKNRTRQFIYFIQTEGGFHNLGLADDEYSTEDLFPYRPYHRETRRLDGLTMLTMNELVDPYAVQNDLYMTAIGVGDYPLDHHRELNPSPPAELLEDGDREPYEFETHFDAFPPIPSFSIPFGSLIPKKTDGLMVAEKSISVSSIANGSSRLQPAVMTIGQAAGAAAAMAIRQGVQPRELSVRQLQQHLLDNDCWALPFIDTTPDDWHFQPLQRVGLSGVLKGHGVPYLWANQTWIYPDSAMTRMQVSEALVRSTTDLAVDHAAWDGEGLATRGDVVLFVWEMIGSPQPEDGTAGDNGTPGSDGASAFEDVDAGGALAQAVAYAAAAGWTDHWTDGAHFEPNAPVTRKAFAQIVDQALNPFESISVSIVPERYQR